MLIINLVIIKVLSRNKTCCYQLGLIKDIFFFNQLRILLKGCVFYKRNIVLLIITIVKSVNFVLKTLQFKHFSSNFFCKMLKWGYFR